MPDERPYCLSIAGFDPSAGAGVLADIKTFEQHKVYGLGVTSALTYQNDSSFDGVRWCPENEIMSQIIPLQKYNIKAIKIGLIENISVLELLLDQLKIIFPLAFIIWDPILKASAGFEFHNNSQIPTEILSNIDLITPNLDEFNQLGFQNGLPDCAVLLKGGHAETNKGTDVLYFQNKQFTIEGNTLPHTEKHGTGCVLSSAICANIALGNELPDACKNAKAYIEKIISSNNSKLGYHQK